MSESIVISTEGTDIRVLREGREFPINTRGELICPNDNAVLVWNAGSAICPVCKYLLDAEAVG